MTDQILGRVNELWHSDVAAADDAIASCSLNADLPLLPSTIDIFPVYSTGVIHYWMAREEFINN